MTLDTFRLNRIAVLCFTLLLAASLPASGEDICSREGKSKMRAANVTEPQIVKICPATPLQPGTASGLSEEEKNRYSSECKNFVEENAPGRFGSMGFDMKVFDIYKKKGKWVFEVGYKRNADYGDTYSVQLCVFDAENNRLTLPTSMGAGEWSK